MEEKKRAIGCLWAKTSRSSGQTFFTGKVVIDGNEVEIIVLPNYFKQRALTETPDDPGVQRKADMEIFIKDPLQKKG